MKWMLSCILLTLLTGAHAETYLRTNNGDIKLSAVREYLTRKIYGYYYGTKDEPGYKLYNERARREIREIRISEKSYTFNDAYDLENSDYFNVSFRFRNRRESCELKVHHRKDRIGGGHFIKCSKRMEKIMNGYVHDIMNDRLYENYRR